ncbi:DUF3231 family protein [Bacillaceae bacterium W0354]
MKGLDQTRLTSAEISVVWSAYLNNSFAICIMKYFLNNTDDQDVKSVLEFSLKIAEKNLNKSEELLKKDGQPIPVGFTEDDVSTNAPRLYSDAFYLYYLKNMAKVGLSVYGVALATAAQSDVRKFLSKAIEQSTELYNQTAEVLLSKGLYVRAPFVTTMDHVDFIDSKDYLGGMLSSNNRPLNVIEITHLEGNIEANAVGKTLLLGLGQVAKSKEVRDYCLQGSEIANKHIKIFQSLLSKDDVTTPTPWDVPITDSTVAPFSDKLIMFHTTLLISSSISNYATASAASLRTDIATSYVRLTAENAKYAKEGVNILIKNEWFEQPPQIPDHKGLAKGKNE